MEKKLNIYDDFYVFMIIFDILKNNNSINKFNFMHVANSGSSKSKVYLFKDLNKKMYAVKVCNKEMARVSLKKEQENNEILKSYLKAHLPSVIGVYDRMNYEIMISECNGIDNLYTSIIYNKQALNFHLKIWIDFLKTIMTMWNVTKHPYNSLQNPRNVNLRIQRIEEALKKTSYNNFSLQDLWHKKIIINNQEFFSLSKAFEIIKTITNPGFGVTCHGDPQPSNIIINEKGKWYLVDWEWSGKNHDYRMMFAHLYGWWNTRMSYLKKKALFTIDGDNIIIKYDILENKIIQKFQASAIHHLKKYIRFANEDILDINKFLALLYLGDIRFISIWGKKQYFPILIGEAVKTLNYCITKDISKINSQFTLSENI